MDGGRVACRGETGEFWEGTVRGEMLACLGEGDG